MKRLKNCPKHIRLLQELFQAETAQEALQELIQLGNVEGDCLDCAKLEAEATGEPLQIVLERRRKIGDKAVSEFDEIVVRGGTPMGTLVDGSEIIFEPD
jgi:hypothetical protein